MLNLLTYLNICIAAIFSSSLLKAGRILIGLKLLNLSFTSALKMGIIFAHLYSLGMYSVLKERLNKCDIG